ncbi:hypothetical protein PR048_024383 [Dryococelus australis]|uniref:Uncharacterized protein n=1 Tax=Dryococelus australis TaxID=614101 RepID=A0ABQ9GNH3_9NEOP|nr:hypothetical protein PR048_024383 [Dryococelus australis]
MAPAIVILEVIQEDSQLDRQTSGVTGCCPALWGWTHLIPPLQGCRLTTLSERTVNNGQAVGLSRCSAPCLRHGPSPLLEVSAGLVTKQECSGETGWRLSPPRRITRSSKPAVSFSGYLTEFNPADMTSFAARHYVNGGRAAGPRLSVGSTAAAASAKLGTARDAGSRAEPTIAELSRAPPRAGKSARRPRTERLSWRGQACARDIRKEWDGVVLYASVLVVSLSSLSLQSPGEMTSRVSQRAVGIAVASAILLLVLLVVLLWAGVGAGLFRSGTPPPSQLHASGDGPSLAAATGADKGGACVAVLFTYRFNDIGSTSWRTKVTSSAVPHSPVRRRWETIRQFSHVPNVHANFGQESVGLTTIYLAFHWLLAIVSCASGLCDSGIPAQGVPGSSPRSRGGIVDRLPTSYLESIPQRGRSRIFACGNRAGRCRWLAGFLGDLPLYSSSHSGAAARPPHFTHIGLNYVSECLKYMFICGIIQRASNTVLYDKNTRLQTRTAACFQDATHSRNTISKDSTAFLILLLTGHMFFHTRLDQTVCGCTRIGCYVPLYTCPLFLKNPRSLHDEVGPRPLASHQGDLGSIPGRATPARLLGDFPFPPPLHSRATTYSPRFTLIGSQDLDVKSRPNLFTHSFMTKCVFIEFLHTCSFVSPCYFDLRASLVLQWKSLSCARADFDRSIFPAKGLQGLSADESEHSFCGSMPERTNAFQYVDQPPQGTFNTSTSRHRVLSIRRPAATGYFQYVDQPPQGTFNTSTSRHRVLSIRRPAATGYFQYVDQPPQGTFNTSTSRHRVLSIRRPAATGYFQYVDQPPQGTFNTSTSRHRVLSIRRPAATGYFQYVDQPPQGTFNTSTSRHSVLERVKVGTVGWPGIQVAYRCNARSVSPINIEKEHKGRGTKFHKGNGRRGDVGKQVTVNQLRGEGWEGGGERPLQMRFMCVRCVIYFPPVREHRAVALRQPLNHGLRARLWTEPRQDDPRPIGRRFTGDANRLRTYGRRPNKHLAAPTSALRRNWPCLRTTPAPRLESIAPAGRYRNYRASTTAAALARQYSCIRQDIPAYSTIDRDLRNSRVQRPRNIVAPSYKGHTGTLYKSATAPTHAGLGTGVLCSRSAWDYQW